MYIKKNLSGSNTDHSFTTAVSNYDKIPVLQTLLSGIILGCFIFYIAKGMSMRRF